MKMTVMGHEIIFKKKPGREWSAHTDIPKTSS